MAGRPIEQYVTRHILEHGGFEALIERIRRGETVSMIARTLFKPDGQAIDRTTLSHMLHARTDRSAQVAAAKAEWRKRPQRERLATRKRLRATAPQRTLRAMGLMHEQPAPSVLPQRAIPRHPSPPSLPAPAAPSIPMQSAARRSVVTPPAPEPFPKRHGVEWDERRPWCYDCDRNDCLHVKQEYMRRAERYKREHPPVVARLKGLV
jgi:hypothetical protein